MLVVRFSQFDPERNSVTRSVNHVVGPQEDRWREGEAEKLCGFGVDHQFEFRGLLDGQIGGLGSLQKLGHDHSCLPPHPGKTWSIGHETTSLSLFSPLIDCWQALFCRKRNDLPRQGSENR